MPIRTAGMLLNDLPPGKFVKLAKVIPAGSLEARRQTAGGVMFYWRVTCGGKGKREPLGCYDSSAPPKSLSPTSRGYSIEAAKIAAQELAVLHHANLGRGGYQVLKAERQAERKAAEAAATALSEHTLSALMKDYADHLASLGRTSHADVRSITKLHIDTAWPKLAQLPANQITSEQVADMMRKVMDSGKARTANKLRSYVRAAFQTAKASKTKASIPLRFKSYGVTGNPAADTEPDESANRADKNPLSTNELKEYWRAIEKLPGKKGALLRLHLLTGGQRIQQLVSLLSSNVTSDAITIFDTKGRPGKPPRSHMVPLTPLAVEALNAFQPTGHFALSTDNGSTHISATTLSKWACEAVGDRIEGFSAKRLRSGVETLLASAKVSKDIRGRLQSHGISGVQSRHYDGYEYMEEKRDALDTLAKLLVQ